MTNFHIGAVVERLPGPKYTDALRFAEYRPPASLPRPSTLARWRDTAPRDFVTALALPTGLLPSSPHPETQEPDTAKLLEWLREASPALRVAAVVVSGGRHVTPGQRDRDRLASWLEAVGEATSGRVVWSPSGLWEAEPALAYARRLGVVCALDPLECGLPDDDPAYARIKAVGSRARLTEGSIDSVADALLRAGPSEAYISIDSARSFTDAQRIQSFLGPEPE